MKPYALQEALFRKIRARIPSHLALELEVARLLEVAVETVFRWVRNIEPLPLDIAARIAAEFSLSLDALTTNSPTGMEFRFRAPRYSAENIEDYLEGLMQEIKLTELFGTRQLRYAAVDLPLFAAFGFRELTAFKLYFWARVVYDLPAWQNRKFAIDTFPSEPMRAAEQTWKQYLKIPSVEIWNSTVIDNALRQIFAVWRLGLFASPDDAHRVCDSLAELLTHVEAQALVGKKLHPFMPPPARENYKLFYTETGINNNTILMKTDRQTVSYIAQNELNYIRTDNDLFNQHLEHWFTRLIGSAELISQANHDLRQRFFLEQTDNIAFVKAQIS